MPIRFRDRWFIFVPDSGRWAIPAAHISTEDKRISYAIKQGARLMTKGADGPIVWRADR